MIGSTVEQDPGSDDAMEKSSAGAVPAQAQQDAGDPKSRALFESKCSQCHELARPLGKTKDRNGWTQTVTRMQKVNGCPISDEEAKTIIDYLVQIRGPATR